MRINLKLINNEIVGAKKPQAKGCNSVDICWSNDYAACSGGSYDECTTDYYACSSGSTDICGVDRSTSCSSKDNA